MSRILSIPPELTIVANNWLHDGWLHGMLGLPARAWNNPDLLVRDIDVESWQAGYAMALESPDVVILANVLGRMRDLGQLKFHSELR